MIEADGVLCDKDSGLRNHRRFDDTRRDRRTKTGMNVDMTFISKMFRIIKGLGPESN